MNLLAALVSFSLAILLILFGITRVGAWVIEQRYPPTGAFTSVEGTRIHHLHVPAGTDSDLPPVVFLHGASANLNDQMLPQRAALEGRAEMLFLDRPGHGWSQRGRGNETPSGQAATIAALMDGLGMERAVIVAHSFGSAVAAMLAVDHPGKVAGLVFVAPASHPWPGGETSWYYELVAKPFVGRLFAETLVLPVGWFSVDGASTCVFAPNPMPQDYARRAAIALVLRPHAFHANAVDVAGLYDQVTQTAPRYREIVAPTVIVTGNRDTVVFEEIHSAGLARDIADARLVAIDNLGHKPDWIAPDLVAGAIEYVAGLDVDLDALARAVEARISGDGGGAAAGCPEPQLPMTQ